jgi:hypothetical protein
MKPNRPGEKIEIQPGMTANVEIQTGKNTTGKQKPLPLSKQGSLF